jgi:hypothetical protein
MLGEILSRHAERHGLHLHSPLAAIVGLNSTLKAWVEKASQGAALLATKVQTP